MYENQEEIGTEFYIKCIKEVLIGGGDTDTNAWIVGGMIGSMIGYSELPSYQRDIVMNWPAIPGDGIPRDDFLIPKMWADKLIKDIYDMAPEKLEIV